MEDARFQIDGPGTYETRDGQKVCILYFMESTGCFIGLCVLNDRSYGAFMWKMKGRWARTYDDQHGRDIIKRISDLPDFKRLWRNTYRESMRYSGRWDQEE